MNLCLQELSKQINYIVKQITKACRILAPGIDISVAQLVLSTCQSNFSHNA